MSVFFRNICQYCNCPKIFSTLEELIIHIEHDHLDFDPKKVAQLEEEKPESIPLSYVLKFSSDDNLPPLYSPLKDDVSFINETVITDLSDFTVNEIMTTLNNNYVINFKEKKMKSDDRRLIKNDINEELISSKLFTLDNNHKKPYACNMKGCEKRYKNVNGIKYHYKNYHKMFVPILKKSLLKSKYIVNPPKTRTDKRELQGVPLYSFPTEYYYQSPTTSSTQVPLAKNMSFNYQLFSDIEDFSGMSNSSYLMSNFDKY